MLKQKSIRYVGNHYLLSRPNSCLKSRFLLVDEFFKGKLHEQVNVTKFLFCFYRLGSSRNVFFWICFSSQMSRIFTVIRMGSRYAQHRRCHLDLPSRRHGSSSLPGISEPEGNHYYNTLVSQKMTIYTKVPTSLWALQCLLWLKLHNFIPGLGQPLS